MINFGRDELQRDGVRGGLEQFRWDSVKSQVLRDRECYLGQSVRIGMQGKFGRFQTFDWWQRAEAKQKMGVEQAKLRELEKQMQDEALGLKPKKALIDPAATLSHLQRSSSQDSQASVSSDRESSEHHRRDHRDKAREKKRRHHKRRRSHDSQDVTRRDIGKMRNEGYESEVEAEAQPPRHHRRLSRHEADEIDRRRYTNHRSPSPAAEARKKPIRRLFNDQPYHDQGDEDIKYHRRYDSPRRRRESADRVEPDSSRWDRRRDPEHHSYREEDRGRHRFRDRSPERRRPFAEPPRGSSYRPHNDRYESR